MTPDKTNTQAPNEWAAFLTWTQNHGIDTRDASQEKALFGAWMARAALRPTPPDPSLDPVKLVKDFAQAIAELTAASGSSGGDSYLQPFRDRAHAAKAALLAEFTRLAAVRPEAAIDAQWVVNRCDEAMKEWAVSDTRAIVQIIRSQALASIAEAKRAALRPAPSPQGAQTATVPLDAAGMAACPFCGQRGAADGIVYFRSGCWSSTCIASIYNTARRFPSMEEAVSAWNHRAPTPSETLTAPVEAGFSGVMRDESFRQAREAAGQITRRTRDSELLVLANKIFRICSDALGDHSQPAPTETPGTATPAAQAPEGIKAYRLRQLSENLLRKAINIAQEKSPKWYKNSDEKIAAILALKDQWDNEGAAIDATPKGTEPPARPDDCIHGVGLCTGSCAKGSK